MEGLNSDDDGSKYLSVSHLDNVVCSSANMPPLPFVIGAIGSIVKNENNPVLFYYHTSTIDPGKQ